MSDMRTLVVLDKFPFPFDTPLFQLRQGAHDHADGMTTINYERV